MRSFSYLKADDTGSALALHAEAREAEPFGDAAMYLAGGTTMLDLMKLGVLRPSRLVDIRGLDAEREQIRLDEHGALHVDALTTMADAARHPDITRLYPVFSQSLLLAASPQIRNMATLGGNVLQRTRCVFYRDPSWTACNKRTPGAGCEAVAGRHGGHAVLGASDACAAVYPGDFAQALLALDAEVSLVGPAGNRTIPFSDVHLAPGSTPHLETSLTDGELIRSFVISARPWARRSLYLKIRDRQSYEFAVASAAIAIDLDGLLVRDVRIALGGMATKPWRAREAEQALIGRELGEKSATDAAALAFAQAQAHSGAAWQIKLGKATLVRALVEAGRLDVQ